MSNNPLVTALLWCVVFWLAVIIFVHQVFTNAPS